MPDPDPESQTSAPADTSSDPPVVWLLMGNRAGDNSQVLGLGEALGWPLIEKHFEFQPWEKVVNLPWGAHLLGILGRTFRKRACARGFYPFTQA